MIDDTIAAIATATGEAALAVIRISGTDALSIADRCFRPAGSRHCRLVDAPSHTVHYGEIRRCDETVDEVLLSVFRAPRTFTREDVVEISCHGGAVPARAVLESVLEAGARSADPGEFTRRAFLNGRLDLTQAEAVIDIIHSRTDRALRTANLHLRGHLSRRIGALREDLVGLLAHLEAHLDFPEEDIAPDTEDAMRGRLEDAIGSMEELLASAREGRILRHGVRVAIVGAPNVGKSSLLNALLDRNRAIVSERAGTTRDTIEESSVIRGLPVVFTDTAGLRPSGDAIELEGMRRSRESIGASDLILHVRDIRGGGEPLPLPENIPSLVVENKADLLARDAVRPDSAFVVSCLTGEGLESLRDGIAEAVGRSGMRQERFDIAINARHRDALERSRSAACRALESMRARQPLEVVALDLRIAVQGVGEIAGKTSTEDLLDRIFGEFCLGK